MREFLVGSLLLALIVSAAAPAVAAPATVGDILSQPKAYIDKRITVSGVLTPVVVWSNVWSLCPTEAERAAVSRPITVEHPICIDLRLRERLDRQPEKYIGAVVSLTGLYWHRCLPEIRAQEPAIAKTDYDCRDDGLNGKLGVEKLVIRGYVQDGNPNGLNDRQYVLSEPLLDEAQRNQLSAFVATFLRAVKARDVDTLALLYAKNLRGRARVGFRPGNHLDWRILSPDLRVTNAQAAAPVDGYRVFVQGSDSYHLCFCRHQRCDWQTLDSGIVNYLNVASPIFCHQISRKKDEWWLDD